MDHDAHVADAYEHMAQWWDTQCRDDDNSVLCFFERRETVTESTTYDYDFARRGQ